MVPEPVFHTFLVASRHQKFLGGERREEGGYVVYGPFRHLESPGGDIQERSPAPVLVERQACKIIVLLLLKELVIERYARSDKLGHPPLHYFLREFRILKLVAYSHLVPRPDEPREIKVYRMVRKPGQRHGRGRPVRPFRKHYSQNLAGDKRIVSEGLIKIPHAKQQYGIRMDGRFAGRTFEGRISSSDPNLDFVTSGRFSLAEDVPAYDFEMDLNNADLVALKLNRRDSVSRLAMRFRAHATGTTLDNINGTAAIDSLSYVNHIDTVHTGVIHFEAQNTPKSKRLIMRSDFADSELRGSNSYNHIFRFFGQTLKQYLPSMPAGTAPPTAGEGTAAENQTEEGSQPSPVERDPAGEGAEAENGYYLVKLNVKQANNVAAIFVPGLEIAEGSSLAFLFNPYLNDFSLSVKSDYILQRQFYVGNLVVECRNQADSVSIYASADQFGVGNLDLPNLSVVGGIRDNRIALATRFRNPDNGANALISTSTTFGRSVDGLPQMDVALNPTTFFVGGQLWYITPSHVVLDSTGIDFHRFRLWGGGQELSINGRASASEEDTLQIRMQNFESL